MSKHTVVPQPSSFAFRIIYDTPSAYDALPFSSRKLPAPPDVLLVRLSTRNSPRRVRVRAGNVRATYVLVLALSHVSRSRRVGDTPGSDTRHTTGTWTSRFYSERRYSPSTANAACAIPLAAAYDSSRGGGDERRVPEEQRPPPRCGCS